MLKKHVLLVEDDRDLQESLKTLLSEEGCVVTTAGTGAEALRVVDKVLPDLVILDLGLPDITGESLCFQIRKRYPELLIMILTAKGTSEDVVKGLSLGADDYIPKPFNSEELLARMRALLRRQGLTDEVIKVDDLSLNPKTLEVNRGGKSIELTQTEFKLLHYLLVNKGRILTREMILNHVWSYDVDVESRVVDVYVGYLRKKIDRGQKKPLIESKRGFGYRIMAGG